MYLVAGFLGAGKTTLLKRMVDRLNEQGLTPLVLMNEFGESNIDNELLEGSRAQMRELIDGCICCTSKADLTRTLHQIATQDKPSAILLEATGLADPVEILDIVTLPNLLDHLQLRSIISLVDANRHGRVPQAEALMKRQAKYADVLLLNKSDLVEPDALAATEKELRELNKRAQIIRTVRAEVDVDALLSPEKSTVEREEGDHAHSHDHGHDHAHDHGHAHDHAEDCDHQHGEGEACNHAAHSHEHHDHDHAHEHHDAACDHDHAHGEACNHNHAHDHAHDHYLSFTIRPQGKADKAKLEAFLNEGVPGLLRLKGFLEVQGIDPQAVLQWTAGDWELLALPPRMKQKQNVLVFIGDGLKRDEIRKQLAACGLELEVVAHEH